MRYPLLGINYFLRTGRSLVRLVECPILAEPSSYLRFSVCGPHPNRSALLEAFTSRVELEENLGVQALCVDF